jgi:hypothetical protein
MVKQLQQHIQQIKQFDKDRIFWLRLSGFVAISILLIILDWTFLGFKTIHWSLISVGLILSVTWWYWTMKLVKELLNHRLAEIEILTDIIGDIKEIQKDVKKLDQDA